MTRRARETIYERLVPLIQAGIGMASVEDIERLNVLQASMLAMTRAVAALPSTPDIVLVDGDRAPLLACPAQPIIHGDMLCLSIAAASILAKVTRDRLMADLALAYPDYGWERNCGYATADHVAAVLRFGPTPEHRLGFRVGRVHSTQEP